MANSGGGGGGGGAAGIYAVMCDHFQRVGYEILPICKADGAREV